MFSEEIVKSKCGPVARIENRLSQELDLLKSFSKKREAPA